MHHVLTLIAPPTAVKLRARAELLGQLRAKLNPLRTVWLSEDACDLLLEHPPAGEAREVIHRLAAEQAIDIVLQKVSTRDKRLFLSDMDSTMIEQECIDELAESVGLRSHVAEITERAMRGELDFAAALTARVALLKGLPVAELQHVYDARITLMSGAKTLLATLRHRGVKTLLVSGGFTFFTRRVADELGFDAEQANDLVLEEGVLNGSVRAPILGKEAKREALITLATRHRMPLSATIAVGDGANDLPMLQTAGLGVAYHAKPVVVAGAHAALRHTDLTSLLYAMGIPKTEWTVV
jgi:phosphoserine phosphatase